MMLTRPSIRVCCDPKHGITSKVMSSQGETGSPARRLCFAKLAAICPVCSSHASLHHDCDRRDKRGYKKNEVGVPGLTRPLKSPHKPKVDNLNIVYLISVVTEQRRRRS
ncbi:hypothetical protein J6590_013298 [Homalodisca vitripennis]|nr:hypothetical protein J6590_013298 [Homalodisca vitripennis]